MTDMEFENQLRAIASGMEYPRTPDISGSVMPRLRLSTQPRFFSRKLAWSLTIVLIIISSLAFIPPVRAAIIEFIQIGVVRIFPRSVEPTPEAIRTATPQATPPLIAIPDSSLIPLLKNIAGETTLIDAMETVPYSILLPAHPSDLGQPDYVFVQNADGYMTFLVWMDPKQSDKVKMSLHIIPSESWAISKFGPKVIEETQVNGQKAIWAVGPYPLKLSNGDIDVTRLIQGNVLIWAEGNITYRLETDLSLDEAIKVAESLEPVP